MKMKNKISFILLACVLLFSCQKEHNVMVSIRYTKEIDFGKVKEGDTIRKSFMIKNVSDVPLKIKNVKSSCGCTIAKLKDSVVYQNKSTEIKVHFIADSHNVGKIRKSIIVDSNTKPNFTVMYLKGIVEKL